MIMSKQVTMAHFDSIGLKYRDIDERAIRVVFSGLDNMPNDINIVIIFDEGDETCGLRCFDYLKFPPSKKTAMYELCSKMNDHFRWVKFYVDEDDNTITLSDDAVIQLDSCGEELTELIHRMVGIGDDACPHFMKGIWG